MTYKELVAVYEKLESTTKRLEKTYHVAQLLKKSTDKEIPVLMLLLQGIIFPAWEEKKIGVAARLVLKAINVATGIDTKKIEKEWKDTGDLGKVAENLVARKKQATLFSRELSIEKVYSNLKLLADLTGQGTVDKKVKLIAELLTSAKPNEAKYIIRTVLEDLRVGAGEGVLRDAIVSAYFPAIYGISDYCISCNKIVAATDKCIECNSKLDGKFNAAHIEKFEKYIESYNNNLKSAKDKIKILKVKSIEELKHEVLNNYDVIICNDEKQAREAYNFLVASLQEALDISNDFADAALLAKNKGLSGLSNVKLEALSPIKVMLYQKAADILDAFEQVSRPAALEFKYDGFRLQLHRNEDNIKLFTRRLEDVTEQFPDVVKVVKENIRSKNFILDSEVIGYDTKTKKFLPFQHISQRIKRKYDIKELTEKVPVIVNLFDAVLVDERNLIKLPFAERRAILKKITNEVPFKIQLAEQLITADNKEAEKFYKKALELGNEGVMAKNLEAPYKPGSRVGYGVKIKPTMENLDLVIVAAEWGEGKRSRWLSSFTVACRDDDTGELLELGKVSTGLKEKAEEGISFEEMTRLLEPLFEQETNDSEKTKSVKEVRVKPLIVIEISYEEIQKSPTYTSGFALRFPRVLRLRADKPVDEVSTLMQVEELFYGQK